MSKPILLEVEQLKVTFLPDIQAVRGIDLKIYKQEIVALVGESGCGKSVTAHSLMQLIKAGPGVEQSGSIKYQGTELLGVPEKDLNLFRGKEIGMVFQEPLTALNPLMAIGRQIAEPMVYHLGLTWPQAQARAIDLLRRVQIDQPERRARQYPHQLSGGQRQRVVIAMAIACAPRLLIADEPTTALDVTVQDQILALLQELQRENRLSLLLITHNLGVVAQLCDRVYVMYAGRIVEQGETKRVLGHPQHPYTAGLIASYPELGAVGEELPVIKGSVPYPGQISPGCAFHPRCPQGKQRG